MFITREFPEIEQLYYEAEVRSRFGKSIRRGTKPEFVGFMAFLPRRITGTTHFSETYSKWTHKIGNCGGALWVGGRGSVYPYFQMNYYILNFEFIRLFSFL